MALWNSCSGHQGIVAGRPAGMRAYLGEKWSFADSIPFPSHSSLPPYLSFHLLSLSLPFFPISTPPPLHFPIFTILTSLSPFSLSHTHTADRKRDVDEIAKRHPNKVPVSQILTFSASKFAFIRSQQLLLHFLSLSSPSVDSGAWEEREEPATARQVKVPSS